MHSKESLPKEARHLQRSPPGIYVVVCEKREMYCRV